MMTPSFLPSRLWRRGLTLLSALGLGACASLNPFADRPVNRPAELVQFSPTLAARMIWTANVGSGGNYFFRPAIAAGHAYAASADGTVIKVALANGAPAWRVGVDARLSAGVGSDGDSTAVVSASGELIVLDAQGRVRWKAPVQGEVLSAPLVGQGFVVVRTTDSRVFGFASESGKRLWLHQRPAPALVLRAAPGMTLGAGVVYVGFPGGRLAALSLINGTVRWDVTVAVPRGATELERVADVVGQPVLDGNQVCVAAFQGRAGCFEIASGASVWARELSSSSGIAVDSRFAYVVDDQSVVQAYARSGGANAWRNEQMRHRQLSAGASVAQAVVFGDLQGMVHWLSRESGAISGRVPTDGSAIRVQPVVFDLSARPAVLVQTQAGMLAALGFQ